MHKSLALPLTACVLSACAANNPANYTQPVSVGAGISTIGLTVEPSYRATDRWGVRAPIGFGSINRNLTVEGIDYDVSASTGGVGVLGDYYPTGGGLRVSGGLFKSNIGSTGRATGTVDVGSGTYAGVDLRTEVETERSIAPMVAVGYDGQIGAGWGLSADLGAIYTGGFKTSITDLSGIVPQSDIDAEVSSVDAAIDEYKVIPYFKLGATYRW